MLQEKSNMLPILAIVLTTTLMLTLALGTYHKQKEMVILERNYYTEVAMQVSPNMNSRTPTTNDIDTQLNLQTSDGNFYRLFESRDSSDFFNYGKTFVVRIK